MKYKVVSIRDRAIDCFGVPFFVANVGGAIRSFGDEVKRVGVGDRPNPLNVHPEDFDLYYLGEFDDSVGVFEGAGRPEQIAVGKDYI